ncbi:GyrI-like domain-containing protein [Paenibacillus sp. 32352]|uniref:GyrI-like domain-containing protein n=1 Tax=Paenibacillus sp. 32352 TaxID=1969111 RepID=UPI0009AD87D4|nr:GyrI-like domain-containing protein [Paenibacillus sp. 32352]
MTLTKIVKDDLKKQLKGVFSTGEKSKQVRIHTLPDLKYIMTTKVGAFDIRKLLDSNKIYKCLNRIKHYTVKHLNKNFIIGPAEFECADRTGKESLITFMICVPDYLEDLHLHSAMVDSLGSIDPSIFFKTVPGGMFAQILHEGYYDNIALTKAKLEEELRVQGYEAIGASTEIIMTPMFFHNRCKVIIRQRIEHAE